MSHKVINIKTKIYIYMKRNYDDEEISGVIRNIETRQLHVHPVIV